MKTVKIKNVKSKQVVEREVDTGTVTAQIIEQMEVKDSQEQEIHGKLSKAFVYHIEKEKTDRATGEKYMQIIEGITITGARELPNYIHKKLSKSPYNFVPQWRYETEKLENGKYTQVVYCKNPKTELETRGQAQWDMNMQFDDRKALSVAKRNALLEHYPTELKLRFLSYCLKNKNVMKLDSATIKKLIPEEKSTEENQLDTAQKAFYAQCKSIGQKWKLHINADELKGWFKKRYKVTHFKDLTVEQARQIWQELYKIGQDKQQTMDVITDAQQMAKEAANEKK
jgi:hypothetical protein